MASDSLLIRTIWGAALASALRCGAVGTVLTLVRRAAAETPNAQPLDLLDCLSDNLNSEYTHASKVGQAEALAYLVAEDVRRIHARLLSSKEHWEQDLQSRLVLVFSKIVASFRDMGIDISYAGFEIVETYPDPYSGLNFWAMNFDATDEAKYGIPIGTRMKRDYLLPVYSESLLAHELVHACFGRVPGPKLARGLEEGLADIVGHLLVGSRLLPWDACVNILSSTRMAFPQSPFWMNYSENLRQGWVVLRNVGMGGLLSVLQEGQQYGRDILAKLEYDILMGNSPRSPKWSRRELDAWVSSKEHEIEHACQRLVVYPQSLCVSPVAFLFADSARVGETFDEVCQRLRLDPEVAREAIQELRNSVFLLLLDENDRVTFNEASLYSRAGVFRYLNVS